MNIVSELALNDDEWMLHFDRIERNTAKKRDVKSSRVSNELLSLLFFIRFSNNKPTSEVKRSVDNERLDTQEQVLTNIILKKLLYF